jgi:2-amino-4-hydroxy-6-hydroxymethyldihydropteridine diphosphokinase
MSERVYFLLGSNVGEREHYLWEARASLEKLAVNGAIASSQVYETAAWGLTEQPSFLNMAVGIDTLLSPEEILREIRDAEACFGRQRERLWGPRTLDVDVLFFGDKIIRTPELHVPHPRLPDRRFALAPLAEIAAGLVHPEFGATIGELLASCADPLQVTSLGHLTLA